MGEFCQEMQEYCDSAAVPPTWPWDITCQIFKNYFCSDNGLWFLVIYGWQKRLCFFPLWIFAERKSFHVTAISSYITKIMLCLLFVGNNKQSLKIEITCWSVSVIWNAGLCVWDNNIMEVYGSWNLLGDVTLSLRRWLVCWVMCINLPSGDEMLVWKCYMICWSMRVNNIMEVYGSWNLLSDVTLWLRRCLVYWVMCLTYLLEMRCWSVSVIWYAGLCEWDNTGRRYTVVATLAGLLGNVY